MTLARATAACFLLWAWVLPGQTPVPEERLEFSINWPSGLSLGEASLETKPVPAPGGGEAQEFRLRIQAALPGFEVADTYLSLATSEFCSLEFEKDFRHGKKAGKERMVFDQTTGAAVRESLGGGGKSELVIPSCAKDALSFLQFFRKEMAAGRVPRPQTIYFGGPYQIRLEYGGRQRVAIGEERMEADRINVSVKGPASDHAFQVYLAVEPERRPLLIRVPLPQGPFTMELTF